MALDGDRSATASEPTSKSGPVALGGPVVLVDDEQHDHADADTDWHILNVWQTIAELKTEGIASKSAEAKELYAETTAQVVSVLETLGHTYGDDMAWKSVLNKQSLKHEVEESIVALHHLGNWIKSKRGHPSSATTDASSELTVVDLCCGKGFFSMLLSFMVGRFWQDFGITAIVLLDKATDINWKYIEVANETAEAEHRPLMTLWKGVNLHEYDILLDRLLGLSQTTRGTNTKLALVGIHLCKNLSPAAVSLKNGLGQELCPYMLLAPCCLPRTVTSKYISPSEQNLRVYQYETPAERSKRLATTDQRDRALGRGRKGYCSLCAIDGDHKVKYCPVLKGKTAKERKEILNVAALLLPCWKCGEVGHQAKQCPTLEGTTDEERKAILKGAIRVLSCWKCGEVGHQRGDCPSSERPTKNDPPSAYYSVASVLSASQPFAQYCQVLGTALGMENAEQQDGATAEELPTATATCSVVIHETGLNNAANGHEEEPSQEGNWNKSRKSIYIVAATTMTH